MKCPHCGKTITASTIAKNLASRTSDRKAKTSAENGRLGGRPKGKRGVAGTEKEK